MANEQNVGNAHSGNYSAGGRSDENISLYSLYSTVKYSLFFNFQQVVDKYSDYVAFEGRKMEKEALIISLRKLFVLLRASFGSIDTKYPLISRVFNSLVSGNERVFSDNLNFTQLIFELGGLLHDKNITKVTFKKQHDVAVFSAL